jgi:TRAP-type C4-dicarboxylate transport system permease small subunit
MDIPPKVKATKETLDRQRRAFQAEVLDKMSGLATAAFGLVAALAWNNAIQSFFKRYYPTPDDPNALGALTLYATAVTVIAVVVIILIGRLAGRLKKEVVDEEEEPSPPAKAPPA